MNVAFLLACLCVLGAVIWHVVISRREIKRLPGRTLGPHSSTEFLFSTLPEPARAVYRRLMVRGLLIVFGGITLLGIVAWVTMILANS